MGQLIKRPKPRARKKSPPRERSARSVIKELTSRAKLLEMPIVAIVDRAIRFAHLPNTDPSGLLRHYMLKSERVFLWAYEHKFGKPPAHLETTGPGGGPMELKVVIQRLGEEDASPQTSAEKAGKSEENNVPQHHRV